jgi:hypothetical protein
MDVEKFKESEPHGTFPGRRKSISPLAEMRGGERRRTLEGYDDGFKLV